MVKVTNTTNKFVYRRLPRGGYVDWPPKGTVDVTSKRLLQELKGRGFVIHKDVGPKVGGGVKTHVKTPKPRGRPSKTKAKKEVAKSKKGLKKTKGKAD
tara:strand:- start:359 stop:652 length:294 start_codon:yes stop_codon:yes gene_type:complete